MELLKTYRPEHIGLYGTSAGAILTAEVTVKLKQLKLPLPAVTGVFSGLGDLGRAGDSMALFALNGFAGQLDDPNPNNRGSKEYTSFNSAQRSGAVSRVRRPFRLSANSLYH
jgi:acetyl esterase/lipase